MSRTKNSIVETDAQAEEMYQDYLEGQSNHTTIADNNLSIQVMRHSDDMMTVMICASGMNSCCHLTKDGALALADAITQMMGGR